MKRLFLLLILPLILLNCEDVDEEDHHDIIGVRLLVNEQVIASTNGTEVTGSITLTQGETLDNIYVEFLEPDGEAANAEFDEEEDEEVSMSVSVASPDVATFTLSQTNAWTFSIAGSASGTTTLTVSLLHGEHEDFISREIPIVVSAP